MTTARPALEQALLEKLRALPPDKQQEVVDFAEFLRVRYRVPGRARRGLEGLWADLDIDLTNDDIDEMRREAWANFPRELPAEDA